MMYYYHALIQWLLMSSSQWQYLHILKSSLHIRDYSSKNDEKACLPVFTQIVRPHNAALYLLRIAAGKKKLKKILHESYFHFAWLQETAITNVSFLGKNSSTHYPKNKPFLGHRKMQWICNLFVL